MGFENRTHCKHGHRYTASTTNWKRGYRECKICTENKKFKRREDRKKAKAIKS